MKINITTATPIAVETFLNGNIVLGELVPNPGNGEVGPHFVLVDDESDDYPILWEGQDLTFHKGWFVFEDSAFGEVKFKFAGY